MHPLRPRLGLPSRSALLAAVLLALVAGPIPAAHAESGAAARRAAQQAAAELDALSPRLQTALQAYQQALDDVATGVQVQVGRDQAADGAAETARTARRDQSARVRALYMSGGSLGLMASVLGSGSPSDIADRIVSVRQVVTRGGRHAEDLAGHSARLRGSVGAAAGALRTRVVTARDVEARYAAVQALLAQAHVRLATLSARARSLTEAEAAAARLRALADASARAGAGLVSRAHPMTIPPEYRRLYHAAATTCPGLSWTVLAAIGQVESGHGSNTNTSYAGAQGPMQFMPSTFASYAVDGDHDGVLDIRNPADAIYSAAHYLCANGAGRSPEGLHFAILRYNHAEWYAQLVLRLAALIR